MKKTKYIYIALTCMITMMLLSPLTTGYNSIKSFKEEKQSCTDYTDEPPLNVTLRVIRIGFTRYFIKVRIKNMGEETLDLGVRRPAGGYIVANESDKEIFSAPRYTIFSITSLTLEPQQSKTIYRGILKLGWKKPKECLRVYGVFFNYEYNRKIYPMIKSPSFVLNPHRPMVFI